MVQLLILLWLLHFISAVTITDGDNLTLTNWFKAPSDDVLFNTINTQSINFILLTNMATNTKKIVSFELTAINLYNDRTGC